MNRAIRSSADDVESARVDGDCGAGAGETEVGGGVADFGSDDVDGERGIDVVGDVLFVVALPLAVPVGVEFESADVLQPERCVSDTNAVAYLSHTVLP